jgi:hypothetical protein
LRLRKNATATGTRPTLGTGGAVAKVTLGATVRGLLLLFAP